MRCSISLTTLAFLKSSSLGFLGFEILYKFSFQISLTNVLMFFHRLFLFYLFLTECCSLPFLVLLFSFFHSTELPRKSHPLTVIDVVHCAHNSNFSSYYSYPHSYAAAKLALFPSLECLGIRFYQRAFLVALCDSVLMLPNKLQHT